MTEINGRVAVVTGGASGIGRGIAEELIDRGATVVIADIEAGALESAAAELGVIGVVTDVSDYASVEALRDAVVDRYGRADIVVNNAGVGPWAAIDQLTVEDWRWIIGVNLFGVIHGVTAFLPVLHANPDGGHIVNTASMAAFDPPAGLGAYSTTKFGVAALTETLEIEERARGGNVHTTLLAPGFVRTNINTSTRNRPAVLAGALSNNSAIDDGEALAAGERWMTPREVGFVVARAILANDVLALTHPERWTQVERRHARIAAAFERYPVHPPAAERPDHASATFAPDC